MGGEMARIAELIEIKIGCTHRVSRVDRSGGSNVIPARTPNVASFTRPEQDLAQTVYEMYALSPREIEVVEGRRRDTVVQV